MQEEETDEADAVPTNQPQANPQPQTLNPKP